jgi:hypothetical protein
MATAAEEFPMKVSWPQAVLALGITAIFFTTVIILTNLGVNVTEIMTTCVLLLISVLSVLGWRNQEKMDHKIEQVKETSNGRLSDVIEQNRQLQEQVTALALQIQPRDPL